jgi:lipopolysaccharide transport system ATP-binding protein
MTGVDEAGTAGNALVVDGLSKCYRLWDDPKDRLKHPMRDMLSRWLPLSPKTYFREFWALRDVSFELPRGSSLGIIGRNGSGKSTLLQMLCGTLTPTSGDFEVNGRVSALLELGAGFNPEFTGRENVYMNASILGLNRSETDAHFDDIVSFADIGGFLDQPVKTYSSGMYVRLAFAVAISVDPDILVVDEALAIGDTLFQNKCYRKFEQLRSAGKTVVFVTHSTDLVPKHCDRCLVLDGGRSYFLGAADEAVNVYMDLLYGTSGRSPRGPALAPVVVGGSPREVVDVASGAIGENAEGAIDRLLSERATDDGFPTHATYNPNEYRYGDFRATQVDYVVVSDGRANVPMVEADEPLDIYVRMCFHEDMDGLVLGIALQTVDGVTVYGVNTRDADVRVPPQTAGDQLIARFSFVPRLVAGDYFVALGIAQLDPERGAVAVDRRYSSIVLHVQNDRVTHGLADLKASIEVGI